MKTATTTERLNELFDKDPRSDSAIADALGVSKQAISLWRNGTRSPKKSKLLELSEMYNVDIAWLLGYDDESEEDRIQYDELHTVEAKILAKGIDKLPPKQREQALNVVKAMFAQHPELFEE